MDDEPKNRPNQARDSKGRFPKGVSGNAGGRPPRLRACHAAIEGARNPAEVLEVLAEFKRRHMEDGDNDAGKTWLAYMIGPAKEADVDLSDAPDAVVRWWAESGPHTN